MMPNVHKEILNELDIFFKDINIFTLHKSFIYGWINDNRVEFCEKEDIAKLEELLSITAGYLNSKQINNVNGNFFSIVKPNRHLTELKARIEDHLKYALKDVESLFMHGSKTKQAIETINQLINDMDEIVPLRPKNKKQNVEDIRVFLRKRGFTKENIDSYIEHFRKSNDEIKQEWLSSENTKNIPQ